MSYFPDDSRARLIHDYSLDPVVSGLPFVEDYFDDLEIKILPDCGHFLHLEKKELTNNLILDFID